MAHGKQYEQQATRDAPKPKTISNYTRHKGLEIIRLKTKKIKIVKSVFNQGVLVLVVQRQEHNDWQ
jgi:very-short-patch-repair endonuclease